MMSSNRFFTKKELDDLLQPNFDAVDLRKEWGHFTQGAVDLELVKDALRFLSSHERNTWLNVGMSLHSTGDIGARTLWDEWSSVSSKYDDAVQDKTWNSFHTDNVIPLRKLGSLFHDAEKAGWSRGKFNISNEKAISTNTERYNERFCIVGTGRETSVYDLLTREYRSLKGFRDLVASDTEMIVTGSGNNSFPKRVCCADLWLKNPEASVADKPIFDPELPPGITTDKNGIRVLNLYHGFVIKPDPSKKFNTIFEHINNIICSNNKDVCKYVIRWLAHAVQRPWELPQTAIILQGEKGTGKNLFTSILQNIYGTSQTLLAYHHEQLFGRFSGHMETCIPIIADEAFWAGSKRDEGALKGLITSPERTIEHKGQSPRMCKNFTRMMITSNEDFVVPATVDERRFLVLEISDARRGDRKYFKQLAEEINGEGLQGFLWYLLNKVNLDGIDIHTAPRTTALDDQIDHNLPSHIEWIEQWLEEGITYYKVEESGIATNIRKIILNDVTDNRILSKYLYASYLLFCDRQKVQHPVNNKILSRYLHKLTGCTPARWYEDGVQLRGLLLPTLESARALFKIWRRRGNTAP